MKKKELVSDERNGEWLFGEVEDRNFIRHDDLNWEQRRWELFNSAVSGLSQRDDLVPSDVVNLARGIVDQGIDAYIGLKNK